MTGLDRWALGRLRERLGAPSVELVLWDDEPAGGSAAGPARARLRIADRAALIELATYPELHAGDLYAEGRLEVAGDLVAALEAVYLKLRKGGRRRGPGSVLDLRCLSRGRSGARRNIHRHYDLGNDFYALWLDREFMQYTCAYYPEGVSTLEEAQQAKMDYVCRKLRLEPGQTVVEAGCGWGGLARFMARRYGVRVRAYNISHEQVCYARERAKREGLGGSVEYVEEDYRSIWGRCDAFVSVGMLEHVGPEHYRRLGDLMARCLVPSGRGLIHTIGRDREVPLNPWIEKRIFPGARPPTLRRMMRLFEPSGFSVQDVENLRLHYAQTLRHWLERYEHNVDRVADRFSERFARAWRLYLAGSIAAFTTGSMQLFQVVFTHAGNNDLPRSRAFLYRDRG